MIQHTPEVRGSAAGTRREPTYESQYEYGTKKAAECVQRNPSASVLVSFGLGFGVGVLLGTMLRDSSYAFGRDETYAERIGHRVMNSLDDVLPSTWKKRLHS